MTQISPQPNPFSATTLEGGGKIAVGTTAVAVNFTSQVKTILISADKDNTGLLYVGNSTVTNTGANAITYLQAGDSISIDYDDVNGDIYVVASAVSQNFWKGGIK